MIHGLEVITGSALLLGAIVAAQRLHRRTRMARLKLLCIALLATAGAVLVTLPVREQISEQRGALQVRR